MSNLRNGHVAVSILVVQTHTCMYPHPVGYFKIDPLQLTLYMSRLSHANIQGVGGIFYVYWEKFFPARFGRHNGFFFFKFFFFFYVYAYVEHLMSNLIEFLYMFVYFFYFIHMVSLHALYGTLCYLAYI